MKTAIFSIFSGIVLVASSPVYAQSPRLDWAINMGGDRTAAGGVTTGRAYSTAVDAMGNAYITGHFNDTAADFDPGPNRAMLRTNGGFDMFVAKYDAAGNLVWAKNIGGSSSDVGYSIALDATGENIYITGSFSGTVNFNPSGSAPLTGNNSPYPDIFIARYDSSGNYVWATGIGGAGTANYGDYGGSIAVDAAGDVYVTGNFRGTANFNPQGSASLTAPGRDAFIAKYHSNGGYVWARNIGGGASATAFGKAIVPDANGDVYVTGSFTDRIDLNAGTGPRDTAYVTSTISSGSSYSSDFFIVKYDGSGNYIWGGSAGGPAADEGAGLALDNAGNIHVTGSFYRTVDFSLGLGTGNLTAAGSPGQDEVFVAKYNSNGGYLWAINMGGPAVDNSSGIAVNKTTGDVYVTGRFNGKADFDPGSGAGDTAYLTANGAPNTGHDIFVARYRANGSYVWAGGMGAADSDQGYGIALDATGNLYVAGQFQHTVDFDPGPGQFPITAHEGTDIFLLRLACGDTSSSALTVSECDSSYTLNGTTYTAAGIYTQRIPNITGCDSTITLNLTFYAIKPAISVNGAVLSVVDTYAAYQWIRNDTAIPGATARTYTVTGNARYQVSVTNHRGCTGTSDTYTVTNMSVHSSDGARHITVYPNPAHDVIHIGSPVKVRAVISSMEGGKMLQVENAETISVKDLAAGIYLMRITDQEGRLMKMEKIVKQ